MKKAFVLAMGLLALSWSLSWGDLQVHKARYLGNPRINPSTEPAWHNSNGRGPAAFPGTAVLLDSSANPNGIYVSRINGTSSNGDLIVGKVLRHIVPGTGYLENFTWTNGGNPPEIFTQDPNINGTNYGRFPWSQFDAPETYGFVTAAQVISGAFAQPIYIRNSGGYGSGLWDAPQDLRPSGESYQNACGLWASDISPYRICVTMEATSGSIPLMSEVIDPLGNIVSDIQTVFDQYGGTADCRHGKLACFGGGPTDGMNIKTSTDAGVTWVPDSMGIWALSADSGWWEYQTVVLQDGSVGVLVTMDSIGHMWYGHNTPHGALQFFMKNRPFPNKVTVFHPTMDQACTFPMLSRKDDNTLVALFMYKESGWDSIAWSTGQTFWDLGESHSTDGGVTWSAVRNITHTDSVSECCPQLARHIGSNDKLHITYGTRANPSDPPDILYGQAGEIYNWYLRDSLALGVEAQQPEEPRVISYDLGPVSPNPMRGLGTIAYQLPKPGRATLVVYNSLGQRVRTLLDGIEPAGRFTKVWDGGDESGSEVPAGVYFLRLQAGQAERIGKFVVVR